MKDLIICILIAIPFYGCSQENIVDLFGNTMTIDLPILMELLSSKKDIPSQLTGLYSFETSSEYFFGGEQQYFCAMIIDTPCKNEHEDYLRNINILNKGFSIIYPYSETLYSGVLYNGDYEIHYEVISISFNDHDYYSIYAVSSLDGYLLYMNFCQRDCNSKDILDKGIALFKSIERK